MATSLQQIAQYLDDRGWRYKLDADNVCMITGFEAENGKQFLIVIRLTESGKYLTISIPQVLTNIKDHIHKNALFQTLLTLTWETPLLRWEYDPIEGIVCGSVELLLEDSTLTYNQFDQYLTSLTHLVDQTIPRLTAVMATGIDPGAQQLGERLLLMIQENAPVGFIEVLEQALVARRRRGK